MRYNMRMSIRLALLLSLPLLACRTPDGNAGSAGPTASAAPTRDLPTIAAHTAGMARFDGFLPLHWDGRTGRLLFEVPPPGQEILYYVSLPTGLGSNDVGLDRAQISAQHLVVFRRVGAKVLLVAPNLEWRSSSTEPAVVRGVRESFAESVLFGFDPVAADGERLLVDGTDFFLRDAHGIAGTLEGAGQGRFELERSRSALARELLASFPRNTEVEALLTFRADTPGGEVRSTAAVASSVSFRVHHSFVALLALADSDYVPRTFDPRCGFFSQSWNDVSVPIDRPMTQRVIQRHRLADDRPIVYYVDTAAPEPVRSALLEGARFWEPAFAAAGFPDGFRVELLPEGTDVQDVRYNVITWVNRSTRGWSYGNTVSDPRTGEILKGHVTLGALRVRQDVLLFEGLTNPYRPGHDRDDVVTAAALARIRQLSAHEVGHTLGLAHNFAASTNERASVMDYPAPLVQLFSSRGGDRSIVDLSRAYAPGCGAWDELAIRYGYGRFEDEAAGLGSVLSEMRERGLAYLSDADARGGGSAHPLANLWDNGADAIDALRRTYAIRAAALARLSEQALVPGRPLADLELALVPLYLHHRYQLEAVVRLVGGRSYAYAMVGPDGIEAGPADDPLLAPVEGMRQREALETVLDSLDPAFLRLPRELERKLVPPPPGFRRDRESFAPGGLLVDPFAPARASVETTLSLLLHPERAERLVDQAEDPELPSLVEVLDRVRDRVLGLDRPEDQALAFELQTLFVDELLRLSADESVAARVRARTWAYLAVLRDSFGATTWQGGRIARFLLDPSSVEIPRRPSVPPGSPIGEEACEFGGSQSPGRALPRRSS